MFICFIVWSKIIAKDNSNGRTQMMPEKGFPFTSVFKTVFIVQYNLRKSAIQTYEFTVILTWRGSSEVTVITIWIWLMTCACLLCSRATETFLNHNWGNIVINTFIININIIHNIHITFKWILKSSYVILIAIHMCVNMHLLLNKYISGHSKQWFIDSRYFNINLSN